VPEITVLLSPFDIAEIRRTGELASPVRHLKLLGKAVNEGRRNKAHFLVCKISIKISTRWKICGKIHEATDSEYWKPNEKTSLR